MSLPSLQLEGLKAAAFWDGDNIKLTFIGEIDLENPAEVLDPFLQEVHQKASSKTAEVAVNLKELKFMNLIKQI